MSTPTAISTVYLVAWTGGLEDPSFQSSLTLAQAETFYGEWVAETYDASDRVTLIEQTIDHATGTVTTNKIREYSPAAPDED